jgi:stage V sporulation protein K
MKKTVTYYLTLFLSLLDVGGAVFFGYLILMAYLKSRMPSLTVSRIIPYGNTPVCILCAAGFLVCLAGYVPLALWRQKCRDEMEYDENGISKKYGNFSKLSSTQRQKIEEQKMIDAERILDSATMKKITHKGEPDPEAAMNKLVGLNNVKKDIHEMEARMQYEQAERKKKKEKRPQSEGMHMIFMGPPGTGKTTTARIMTGLLYKYGYIKKNQCVEVDGNFLKGMSPGESSKKTQMLIQKSMGGVLFIDEAYSLLQKNGGSYGQESIATIVKSMEDNRGDIVFILAGYDNEMRELVKSNPGIESRVKYYMWFNGYNLVDLMEIFTHMAGEKGFCITAEMAKLFTDRMIVEMKTDNFGNARSVRNILERMIDRHAVNLMDGKISNNERYFLTGLDMPDKEKRV